MKSTRADLLWPDAEQNNTMQCNAIQAKQCNAWEVWKVECKGKCRAWLLCRGCDSDTGQYNTMQGKCRAGLSQECRGCVSWHWADTWPAPTITIAPGVERPLLFTFFHCIAFLFIALHRIVLQHMALHCIALPHHHHCTRVERPLYSTLFHCYSLHCTLYCITIPHCTAGAWESVTEQTISWCRIYVYIYKYTRIYGDRSWANPEILQGYKLETEPEQSNRGNEKGGDEAKKKTSLQLFLESGRRSWARKNPG